MTFKCDYHGKKHDDFEWRTFTLDGKLVNYCRTGINPVSNDPFAVADFSRKGKRLAHWQDIRNRITTHEGEVLKGAAGAKYIQKYGKKYLGVEPRPINRNSPDVLRELAKTR